MPLSRIFKVAKMSFNAIRENEILAKISEFTVYTMTRFEPRHEIFNNVVCATSKASDQPAHTRSLIRVFSSRMNILVLSRYRLNIIWSF